MVSITDFLFSHSFWKQSSGWTDLMPLWQTAKHIFSSAVVLTKPSDCLLLLLSLNSGIFKIPFLLFCWGFCLFVPTPPNAFGSILGTGVFFCSLRCSPGKCVLVLILREQHQTSLMYVELDWVSTMGSLAKISGKYEKGYFKVCKEQWDWRNPLSISDNKNPLKVLQDMKKSLGSRVCRTEAVPGEKSEWRPPNTEIRIKTDFNFPGFASQICCCTSWMKKRCLWLEVTLMT